MIRTFVKPVVVAASVSAVMFLGSCGKDPKHPGLEFMPDMYRSSSYETYQPNTLFKDSVSALKPVAGTIPRGYDDFPYPNTTEAYESAGMQLKNPLAVNDANSAEGKRLFNIYCQHCHGEKGDGQGTLKIKGEKFPVPSYFDAAHINLPEGKMFFSVTYGKNLMGAHASQVDPNERWKIIQYIKSLQAQALVEKNKTATDSSATANK
ncbi:MAG: c-type cytochrome [Bacteroidia bacterium]